MRLTYRRVSYQPQPRTLATKKTLTGEQFMDNRRLPTLKERLEQIKQSGKHRAMNNRRLKALKTSLEKRNRA